MERETYKDILRSIIHRRGIAFSFGSSGSTLSFICLNKLGVRNLRQIIEKSYEHGYVTLLEYTELKKYRNADFSIPSSLLNPILKLKLKQ